LHSNRKQNWKTLKISMMCWNWWGPTGNIKSVYYIALSFHSQSTTQFCSSISFSCTLSPLTRAKFLKMKRLECCHSPNGEILQFHGNGNLLIFSELKISWFRYYKHFVPTKFVIWREIGSDGTKKLSECFMFASLQNHTRIPCTNGWDYDSSDYSATMSSTFNWVCDKATYPTEAITVASVGGVFGSVLTGLIGDKYKLFTPNSVFENFQIR